MVSEFTILANNQSDFSYQLDELLYSSEFNPIYSSRFVDYYSSISKTVNVDCSHLVTRHGKPVAAFLMTTSEDEGRKKFDYFGNPAGIFTNSKLSPSEIFEALVVLYDYLSSQNFFLAIKSLHLGTFVMKTNSQLVIRSKLFEEFLKKSERVEVGFVRKINLDQSDKSIIEGFSKSVKSAMRHRELQSMEVKIIDKDDSYDKVENAINYLQSLHFDSARRKTRPDESWSIQKNQILNGDAFITQLQKKGGIISSAYFMKTPFDCYYGVSASRRLDSKVSMSHLCVSEAIFYAKRIGLHNLILGNQYSHLSQPISEKQLNIEKFKSFFGGNLIAEVICSL